MGLVTTEAVAVADGVTGIEYSASNPFPVSIGGSGSGGVLIEYNNSSGVATPVSPNTPEPILDYTSHPGDDSTNNVVRVAIATVKGATYANTLFNQQGVGANSAAYLNVEGQSAQLFSVFAYNPSSTVVYLLLCNASSNAQLTVGSASGVIMSIPVPAGTTNNPGSVEYGREMFGDMGVNFPLGLVVALSTTAGTYNPLTTGTTPVAAGTGFGGTYA